MKAEPFKPSGNELAACERLFDWTPTDGVVYKLYRITFDDPLFGYLVALRPHNNDEQGCIWCDWALLLVATTDGGAPLFRGMKTLSEVESEDLEADGFCKWDGCREIHNQAHLCDDRGFSQFLEALRWAVTEASRAAGYEGDK